ncbi:MAG: DUF2849 domain-containing protein [Alphaproteobacteria bacterium]|nr:DUF2849 domain-containing protein [Alphaproteobacteria bacterium]
MPKITAKFKIYNANHLRSGLVVFLTPNLTWSENFSDALIVDDDNALAQKCETEGTRAVDANEIVAPYWIPTIDGTLEGMHMREKMRVLGPTVKSDVIKG